MFDYIASNWQTLLVAGLSVLGGLVVILKAVAPLTPTNVDNKILAGLEKVVGFLSGLVTPRLKP